MGQDTHEKIRLGTSLTKKQRQILRRTRSLKKEINELMRCLISCIEQSDLDGMIATHEMLLEHMNIEVRKVIVDCVAEFS